MYVQLTTMYRRNHNYYICTVLKRETQFCRDLFFYFHSIENKFNNGGTTLSCVELRNPKIIRRLWHSLMSDVFQTYMSSMVFGFCVQTLLPQIRDIYMSSPFMCLYNIKEQEKANVKRYHHLKGAQDLLYPAVWLIIGAGAMLAVWLC